jgi:hypothetical protein
MQPFRVGKSRPRKSSKPVKTWNDRRNEVADSISVEENVAMVACTECVNHGVVCYYDREQSVKCAACLRHQRSCDGTFSLEEFRKVGEQKKQLLLKSRAKRREVARLRQVLAKAELEEADLNDGVAKLEEISSRMLKREMQALGVMEPLDTEQEVALGDPNFAWSELPVTDSVDWSAILGEPGGTPEQIPG